ncbi:hypothetical protein [Methylobacterium sp.]|uniref:hypothetical protein n=1 Tax=Methylobacterium sp. TaxID=409 RepID=UPI003B010EE5
MASRDLEARRLPNWGAAVEISDSLALIASRIRVAWEARRICSLVDCGCWARVIRIGRFVAAGRLDPATELRLASEAGNNTDFFAPCLRSRPYDCC